MLGGKLRLVSACLLGVRCRYDGKSCLNEKLLRLAEMEELLPVCPEQLGGLKTPRNRSWIVDGAGSEVLDGKARVIMEPKKDVTENFIRGAEEVLKLARLFSVKEAVLKSKSPSCGSGEIHRAFSGEFRAGDGVTAALLKQNGIRVITEREFSEKPMDI
jgi:uncharacterized protein YbbK (DUF523 family)